MNRNTASHLSIWLLSVAIVTFASSHAAAQRRAKDPHLAYAFPAGCQQGTSCEIVLGGQHLKEVDEVYLSGDGIEVEIVKWYRPLTRGEYNQLRMRLDEARKKLVEEGKRKPTEDEVALAAGISADQLLEMEVYRKRDRDPKRQPNDQLIEELTVKVTVAKEAAPGKRELRLMTDTAMSNPVWIQAGKWPEVRETEPNDDTPDTVIKQLPIVVNGQIMPGDTDSFSFDAKKGTKLVIVAAARDVIPYLADAVPGWFQAVMKLTDSSGREVSYADSFHHRQDPVIYFEVPRDERYTVHINDTLYRGREDFVYRISVGEIPIITSIFPLGARLNSTATIELKGWNLKQTKLDVKTMSARQYRPVRWYTSEQGDGVSIQFPLQIDRLREVLDTEPNNDISSAQTVSSHMIVNGRIDKPGDEDVFCIQGRGRIVAEIHARRHGSPLDSMLTLTDLKGNELAFNDDHVDKAHGLLTHHADSHIVASVPASGCFLRVNDAQGNGGEDFVYRLYLRAPEPDYELRVTPATIIARAGAVTPITVHALRKDNFKEDIELALIEPPPGFGLSGAVIPGTADHVQMTLTVPSTPPEGPVVLEMAGRARRGTSRSYVTRAAVPAENMMQAFIWYQLVPVEEWNVIVSGKPGPKPPFEILINVPRVTLPRGKEIILPVRPTSKNVNPKNLRVALEEPEGVTAEIVSDEFGRFAIKLTTDSEKSKAGLSGNLLLHAYQETTPAPTEENPNPKPRRTDYGFFPALPFEISGRTR
jgi:hypothetical protein